MLWFAMLSHCKVTISPLVINKYHTEIIWDYVNTVFLIIFWVLLSTSSDGFSLKQYILWCLPNGDFLCSSFFLYLIIVILPKGQISPLVKKPGRHHHLWCLPNGDFLFLSLLLQVVIRILLWRWIYPSVEKTGRSHINQMISVKIIGNGANWHVFLGVMHQEAHISSVKNTELKFSYEEILDKPNGGTFCKITGQ